LVAGFDDDSWPMDKKYFRNVADLFAKLPKIGVVSAQEVNPGKSVLTRASCLIETACFQNGASTIRVKAFLDTDGFLPLQHAYGMEEADVALQLLDHGWSIIHAPDIQVWHNTDFKRHQNPSVNSAHIRNTALLAFLRYPKRYWPLGVIQVLNRLRYALSVGRWQGVGAGIMQIAPVCWKYRKYRKTVHCETIKKSRSLGRNKSG
jgi:GT2 family glycosyltransferase